MADAQTHPSLFDFDMIKMMGDFRFRPFDVEAMMACQRRNIEALSQANQLTVEAVQAVARRGVVVAIIMCCGSNLVAWCSASRPRVERRAGNASPPVSGTSR